MRPIRTRQSGFTLAELLVAATIGLLIMAGLTTMFVKNSRTQAEVEKANRQVENGRYAIALLGGDLRNAAYYGEFDPTVLAAPSAPSDPCAVSVAALKAALPLYVQGYDNGANTPGCLTDVRSGTDIVVVRHASTCTIDDASCEINSAGAPFFQASLCGNASELGSGDSANFYALDATTSTLLRHQHDCTSTAGSGTLAKIRYLQTHVYFIANNHRQGDGIPTLKRAEIVNQDGTLSVAIVALAEGIENLQMEYGLDTNNDGTPDVYTSDPTHFSACTADACAVTNWTNVVTSKINLLARSTQATPGFADTRSYVLGANADGAPNTVAATGDGYKRHVFQSTVVLTNPTGRKTP